MVDIYNRLLSKMDRRGHRAEKHAARNEYGDKEVPVKTVEELESLLVMAESAGYRVRYEVLGGVGGGICNFGGSKWLFVDLSLGPIDRLEQVRAALRSDPILATLPALSAA